MEVLACFAIGRVNLRGCPALWLVPHVPPKGSNKPQKQHRQGKARRWVVEVSHSWTNRARRLLTRWEKKADNYLAFIYLQFAYIALRQAKVLG